MLGKPYMKIIAIDKIGKPFIGILEKEDAWVLFLYSSGNGGYHEITVYEKSNYQSYEHFVAHMCNYKSHGRCLRDPIEIDSLSEEELLRAHNTIQSLLN